MFERFTDRARRAVVLAQEEARSLNHDYIGTEHLLLGLISEGDGLGAKALLACGLTLENTRAEVERRIGKGSSIPRSHIPFTPRAKSVLEIALRQALQLSHNYIGTEHVLLGILREHDGVAAQILASAVEGGLGHITDELLGSMVYSTPRGRATTLELKARLVADLAKESVSTPQEEATAKRLEAIEARLSAIEALLREAREKGAS